VTRRLVLSYVSIAVLVLLCLEIPIGFLYAHNERKSVEGQLEHATEILAAFADEAIREGRPDRLRVLALETAEQVGGRVVILGPTGAVLAASHPLYDEETDPGALSEVRTALRGHAHVGVRTAMLGGVPSLSIAVPTQPAAARGAVRVTIPQARLQAGVHRVWALLAAVGLAVLLVVTVAAFALARWISRPVHALEGATRLLADGVFAAPAPTATGPPELRRLAATFNHTAARLQALIHAQRSFTAHASHQLKTPLAALRIRLENLEPAVADDARRGLAAALTEADRLAVMIDTLLQITRAEHHPERLIVADLDEVITRRIASLEPLAGRRAVRLTVTGDPVGEVDAVADALDQILENLLANALRAAPDGSTITVHRGRARPDPASDEEPAVEVHVIDQGAGLTEEQRQRAFEPFWRAPGAPKGGTGLGLALVRQLTEACAGHVELRPATGTGVDAVVRLRTATRST
jgi:signal transduction histidine kinase